MTGASDRRAVEGKTCLRVGKKINRETLA